MIKLTVSTALRTQAYSSIWTGLMMGFHVGGVKEQYIHAYLFI